MAVLTPEQIDHFNAEGYVVVPGLFDPARDLEPVIAEYEGVLDRLADDLHARGEISSPHAGLGFSERLIRLCEETGRIHAQSFDFSLPQKDIREDTPLWVGPAVFQIVRHSGLLDAVESLVGPEIYSNPVQHVRLKLPEQRAVHDPQGRIVDGATVWHQDNGVVLPEADATEMLTVWFPLWDAPVESGCLQVIPRSRGRGLRDHCPVNGIVTIRDRMLELGQAVPMPMRRGDALFLHRLTCHSSLPNRSRSVRWSFDLRYHPIGQTTGRRAFPGFVVRSRAHPETELHDADQWAGSCYEARRTLARAEALPLFNRWDEKAPACA
jgi:phytanoyl-CoA hydroxylase